MTRGTVLISQRVDIHPDYGERRDALDQKWAGLLWALGFLPQPLFNHPDSVRLCLEQAPPAAIVLTGGNNPVPYDGTAPERDAVDELLLCHAAHTGTPLLGVCRGMQSVVLHFGGTLAPVQDHVGVQHPVRGEISRPVNSYHGLAPADIPPELIVTARTDDGLAEGVRHSTLPIYGIMWHPERIDPFDPADLALLGQYLITDGR